MTVQIATGADIPGWLALAAEVEPLFGPMVDEPAFLRALQNNIGRGSAFCVRDGDGPPGATLLGGMLFSSTHTPLYRIGWLAVAEPARGRGIGRRLVQHALGLVTPPAEVVVTTFAKTVVGGEHARRLYEGFGFRPAETAPNGPEGGARQVFRLVLPAAPAEGNG
jgi:ribosomal protein S18 acetylase RimI-like enzyme